MQRDTEPSKDTKQEGDGRSTRAGNDKRKWMVTPVPEAQEVLSTAAHQIAAGALRVFGAGSPHGQLLTAQGELPTAQDTLKVKTGQLRVGYLPDSFKLLIASKPSTVLGLLEAWKKIRELQALKQIQEPLKVIDHFIPLAETSRSRVGPIEVRMGPDHKTIEKRDEFIEENAKVATDLINEIEKIASQEKRQSLSDLMKEEQRRFPGIPPEQAQNSAKQDLKIQEYRIRRKAMEDVMGRLKDITEKGENEMYNITQTRIFLEIYVRKVCDNIGSIIYDSPFKSLNDEIVSTREKHIQKWLRDAFKDTSEGKR